eukprot:CAMPEP_0205944818 /NCGR_PEP_ID=MMETSP1325-20131115/64300_1 /ASSEMBLY_ACC=CAM_ASM_000708 /TAXON_ID=236786 /ORGANISM="Florenciella sp., Strain RCC1007" /LENGTH=88 /DNA_ID=CAMNT_0053315741 /DNA_START=80 /DNA_END=342 /DNA_ORIENTATION=-
MARCLRALCDDSEILMLKMSKEKMRFREDFDAESMSAGYRCVVALAVWESHARRAHELTHARAHARMLARTKGCADCGEHRHCVDSGS